MRISGQKFPAIVYHVVPSTHVEDVLRHGLRPVADSRSEASGTREATMATWASRADLDDALLNGLADTFDEGDVLAILTVRVPPGARRGQGAGVECVLLDPIAPEQILSIHDEHGRPMAVPGFKPAWVGFRAGALDGVMRGIFFADSFDAAWIYAQHNDTEVSAYALRPQRVLECENQYVWEARRLGSTVTEVMEDKASRRDPYFLRRLDARIRDAARRDGFDAISYTHPTTPNARAEMVMLDAAGCELLGVCDDHGVVLDPSDPVALQGFVLSSDEVPQMPEEAVAGSSTGSSFARDPDR